MTSNQWTDEEIKQLANYKTNYSKSIKDMSVEEQIWILIIRGCLREYYDL